MLPNSASALRKLRDTGCRSNPYPPKPLTVAQARHSENGPLRVTGYLSRSNGELRICNAIIDPGGFRHCVEPSFLVDRAVDEALVGDRASVFGDLDEGVLTIHEAAPGPRLEPSGQRSDCPAAANSPVRRSALDGSRRAWHGRHEAGYYVVAGANCGIRQPRELEWMRQG